MLVSTWKSTERASGCKVLELNSVDYSPIAVGIVAVLTVRIELFVRQSFRFQFLSILLNQ